MLRDGLGRHQVHYDQQPSFRDFRAGDVLHTQADISKAGKMLGYVPTHSIAQGIEEALPWYLRMARRAGGR